MITSPGGAQQARKDPSAVARVTASAANGVVVGDRVAPYVFQGDLRDVPLARVWRPGDPVSVVRRSCGGQAGPRDPNAGVAKAANPAGLATTIPAEPGGGLAPLDFSPPDHSFPGSGFTGRIPPDTVGDVGGPYYVQMVNHPDGSLITIYNKATHAILAGPVNIDGLADPASECATGYFDPIVLFDHLADRWLIAEFAASQVDLCVYVSVGPVPFGANAWTAYDFPSPDGTDYPKFAVWPDAYYASTNDSINPVSHVWALERDAMIAGLPAAMQRFEVPDHVNFILNALTPADLDGPRPPPPGSPGHFMRHRDDEWHDAPGTPGDFLEIWELHVNWVDSSLSSLTGPLDVPVPEFDSEFCPDPLNPYYCIPQPAGSGLYPMSDVVMWRLQYRNFGSHETLVGNFTVDADTDHAGIRWFELRRTPPGPLTPWTLFQDDTLAPDSDHRWLGSIGMDGCGNMGLGYSVSSASTNPGIRYTGRLASDTPGTMQSPEFVLMAGSGSQTSFRWGDYSSLNVDEDDQCTFWYTNEYLPGLPLPNDAQWSTQIGAFSFPSPLCDATIDPDADGVASCVDNCPNDANGSQSDNDGDSVGNACDNCPDVPNTSQADLDTDGVGDACDNCGSASNPDQADLDSDAIGNVCDNCPSISNHVQRDADGDGEGDWCDDCTDTDGDGFGDPGLFNDPLICPDDNCPLVSNPGQVDTDGDGVGEACDNCPEVANPLQENADEDVDGDICDTCTDTDGDGFGDPGFPTNTCPEDNCPRVANPVQADSDGDGIADACDDCPPNAFELHPGEVPRADDPDPSHVPPNFLAMRVFKDPLSRQDLVFKWDRAEGILVPDQYSIWRGSIDALWAGGYDHAITALAYDRLMCNVAEQDPSGLPLIFNTTTVLNEASIIGPATVLFNFYYLITAEKTCPSPPSPSSSANGPFGFANRDAWNPPFIDDPDEIRPGGMVLDTRCEP